MQIILSEKSFNQGKKYIEFLIQGNPLENNIIIGLSIKRNEYNLYINDPLNFWGFNLGECKKFSYNASNKYEYVKYGEATKKGDRIGILMQWNTQNLLNVSYFINKINMGIAFKDLPMKKYHFAVAMKFNSTKIEILKNVGFPDI